MHADSVRYSSRIAVLESHRNPGAMRSTHVRNELIEIAIVGCCCCSNLSPVGILVVVVEIQIAARAPCAGRPRAPSEAAAGDPGRRHLAGSCGRHFRPAPG